MCLCSNPWVGRDPLKATYLCQILELHFPCLLLFICTLPNAIHICPRFVLQQCWNLLFYFFLGHDGEVFSCTVEFHLRWYMRALLRAEEMGAVVLKNTLKVLEDAPLHLALPCYLWLPTHFRTGICIYISPAKECSNLCPLFRTISLYMVNACKHYPESIRITS